MEIDADIYLKTRGKFFDALSELGWYEEDVQTGYRYLDCIFSLKTHLNMFLRLYEPSAVNHYWLLENMDEIFSKTKIKEFCEKHKGSIEINDIILCLNQLDNIAKYTHTIGNYMSCPDNTYNRIKGLYGINRFNDRIEWLLNDLQESTVFENEVGEEWKKWFEVNRKLLFLEKIYSENFEINEKLLLFPKHSKTFQPSEIKDFTNYLKIVNQIIEDRGRRIGNKIERIKIKRRSCIRKYKSNTVYPIKSFKIYRIDTD